VRAQAAGLIASRRRLLLAADRERRRLEARLRDGPERRLTRIAEAIAQVQPSPDDSNDHLERARTQLARTLDDLHELAHGLHPREVTEAGLRGALTSLADRAPVPVELDVRVEQFSDELEATVYFVCAEALANVAKYAGASRAELRVAASGRRLSVAVADDGVGGADASRGTGLQGLADRVEALGGILDVDSPVGAGTRIVAEIPLSGSSSTGGCPR
jgi:signal transduction histidine kinase